VRSFTICIHPKISLGRSNQEERGRWGMLHAWERRESVQGFDGKAKGKKKPLRRPRHGWENGIRMDLWKIRWGGGDLVSSL
jgi:hypothetical protein